MKVWAAQEPGWMELRQEGFPGNWEPGTERGKSEVRVLGVGLNSEAGDL